MAVTETGPLTFEVEVLVRSLVSGADGDFLRQPPRRLAVEVVVGPDGAPRVARPPTTTDGPGPVASQPLALGAVPDQVRAEIEATLGPVIGGEAAPGGGWRVVVMATDPDGVTRPRTVMVGP